MRVRTSLYLLAVATAVPILAFALLAANAVVTQENDSLLNAAKARNRAMISAVEGVARDAISTLQALTVAPSLELDDVQAFDVLARKVLSTQPSWNNLLLHDATGRQLVNASVPWGTALLQKPVAPDSMMRSLSTGQPAIDNLAVAPLLGNRLGVPVRVPVMRNGTAVYVLTAVLAPEAFQRLLVAQDLPSSWISGLVDSEGRLIARVPYRQPGTVVSNDYMRHVADEAREGWYRGTTLQGEDVYTAFMRSDLTRWSISYALPAALVVGSWQHAVWLLGAGVLLSVLAATCIALSLSRGIATPLSRLAEAAGAIGEPSPPPKIESSIDEVNALSAALARAAAALAERDRNLKRSDDELREQASELRRANTNKTQFLALLSHELRNPLAPLRTGLAILALRPDARTAEQAQAIMTRQVAQMARLIDDLLDVSRIDRGVLELRRERVAIDSIVMGAVETVKPELETREQELVVRCAATPMCVDGDPVRLAQVLSNLLNNAAKFTPRGGRIEIATRAEGDDVVIAVSDNGIGFSEDDRGRIFEMFVQLDAGKGQSASGLGVGLTIVRSLVEMHGGRIDATSRGQGRGATFSVRLPRAAVPDAVVTASPHRTDATGGRRVLVVDDNVDAANSLAQMLELHGYDVAAAYDGLQALDVARSFRPEVAFVDLDMPRMGGIELAKTLRAEPWSAGLRLIAVTGMGQKSDIESTRAAGFLAHLTKPAQPEDIIRLACAASSNVVPLHGERAANR